MDKVVLAQFTAPPNDDLFILFVTQGVSLRRQIRQVMEQLIADGTVSTETLLVDSDKPGQELALFVIMPSAQDPASLLQAIFGAIVRESGASVMPRPMSDELYRVGKAVADKVRRGA